MAINQSILQGQGVGQQIGGVSAAQTQYVQDVVERQQQAAAAAASTGTGVSKPRSSQDWESFAWLLLGLL